MKDWTSVKNEASTAFDLYSREALKQVMATCPEESMEADWSSRA
jgi:hypothetical protein